VRADRVDRDALRAATVLQNVVGSHATGASTPPEPIANTDTLASGAPLMAYKWLPLGSTATVPGIRRHGDAGRVGTGLARIGRVAGDLRQRSAGTDREHRHAGPAAIVDVDVAPARVDRDCLWRGAGLAYGERVAGDRRQRPARTDGVHEDAWGLLDPTPLEAALGRHLPRVLPTASRST
jgi:hypothetical protein